MVRVTARLKVSIITVLGHIDHDKTTLPNKMEGDCKKIFLILMKYELQEEKVQKL
jgi:translation elongation factor EF-Tu-like GTPase